MSEINLIFIRHGEAASSWVSHEDPGLSEKGLEQSEAILHREDLQNLKNYKFISSPRKRAIETSRPLVKKFNKKIVIDETFNEIPSSDVDNNKKRQWLEKIVKMKKSDLPKNILDWQQKIYESVLESQGNTVIFSHFMVINSVISNILKSDTILYFYPDNTSVTKIFLLNGRIKSFQIGDNKKTHVNL